MDSATEDLYFQKLQEQIQDDDKIVTVSSCASDLGISVQDSRNLIKKYVEDLRKLKSNELTVTYILSGTLCDKGRGILMVKEEDLETIRKLFETKPSEMIYSVQKSNRVDFNIIALVDMFSSTRTREKALKGSVVSKNCIKRRIKFKKLPSPPPPTVKGKSAFFMPKPSKSEEERKLVEKPGVSPKTEQKSKTGGIANMFKAAAVKSNQKNKQDGSKPGKTNNSTSKQNGGLAGFLTSSSQNAPKTFANGEIKKENSQMSQSDSDRVESQNSIKEEDLMDVDVEEDDVVLIKTETVVEKESPKKKINKKKNKRQRDKSQETPAKKRKRIIERNDSESDDMFDKDDDSDIIEKSDEEPERIPSPVIQKQLAPKNRKRKAVSKTYKDEEGFIVTKMEYEYETASEDENIEPQQTPKQEKIEEKVVKPKVNDKKKPPKNQATLMNFFKKV